MKFKRTNIKCSCGSEVTWSLEAFLTNPMKYRYICNSCRKDIITYIKPTLRGKIRAFKMYKIYCWYYPFIWIYDFFYLYLLKIKK